MTNRLGITPEHPLRAHADKIHKLAEPLLQLLNAKTFSYCRFYWNQTYFSLGSRKDIDSFYWDNNLNEVGGPVLDIAYTPSVVMIDDFANPNSEYAQKVLDPIREKFGLEHFVTYFRNYLGYTEMIIFSAGKENPNLLRNFYTHKKAVKQFVRYFKYKGKDILQAAKKNRLQYLVKVPQSKEAPYISNPEENEKAKARFLNAVKTKRFYLDGTSEETYLSRRELQCLNLAAKGYTFKKIAFELFLSARTVEAHINSVRSKLGIKSKKELPTEIAFNKELTALIHEFDATMKQQRVMPNFDKNNSIHLQMPHNVHAILDPLYFDIEEGNQLKSAANKYEAFQTHHEEV